MNRTHDEYRDRDNDCHSNGTPLHTAAADARSQVVRLLPSRGALSDIEAKENHGRTPLHCAAAGPPVESEDISPLPDLECEETIRILVDAGADLAVLDGYFSPNSPLGYVASWGTAHIVRYLARGDKVTPLHMAAYTWSAAAVQAILDLGADPNATDEYGRQPLHGTTSKPTLKRIWPSQEGHDRTSLHYAAYMKHARTVTLLIQSGGADPSIPDPDGRTTLHLLAEPLYTRNRYGLSDIAIEDTHLTRALTTWLQQGTTNSTIFNQRDNTGATALHIATRCASAPAVALLLALGADPNLTFTPQPKDRETDHEDGAGTTTPLHLAASPPRWVHLWTYGEEEHAVWKLRATRIKELLLAAGADDGVRDGKGWIAGEVEEVVWEGIRKGREKYPEWLARPPPPAGYGRGWVKGWGRGKGRERDMEARRLMLRRGVPGGSGDEYESVPGPTTGNGGPDMAAGAGHGRGLGERGD